MKNKVFNFRMHEDMYEYLKKTSKSNYMTMSGYIVYILKKDMEKNVSNEDS